MTSRFGVLLMTENTEQAMTFEEMLNDATEQERAVAAAMAFEREEDGCFERIAEWRNREQWEREAFADVDYPGGEFEDAMYWVRKARAALAALSRPVPDDTAKQIADRVRKHCTPSVEAYRRGGDFLVEFVADWIENPPEWVDAPWAKPIATLPSSPVPVTEGATSNELQSGSKFGADTEGVDLEGLKVAMLGTTDGGFIDGNAEIPAGEMYRLAADYLRSRLSPPTREELATRIVDVLMTTITDAGQSFSEEEAVAIAKSLLIRGAFSSTPEGADR